MQCELNNNFCTQKLWFFMSVYAVHEMDVCSCISFYRFTPFFPVAPTILSMNYLLTVSDTEKLWDGEKMSSTWLTQVSPIVQSLRLLFSCFSLSNECCSLQLLIRQSHNLIDKAKLQQCSLYCLATANCHFSSNQYFSGQLELTVAILPLRWRVNFKAAICN